MEFVLIGLLLLSFPIIAIVALVKSINLAERLRTIEQRFEVLELRLAGAPGAAPAPPPPSPSASPAATTAAPPIAAEPVRVAPVEPTPEPVTATRAEQPPPEQPAPPVQPPAATEQPAEPELSFEERFGTRWTVWVGGPALALGGIFLV